MTLGSNLSVRLILLSLGGFVLLQMLLWAALALPGRGDGRQPYNLPLPEQVRAMAETLETAAPARRDVLLRTFNGSLYTVRLLPAQGDAGIDREGLDAMRARYAAALPGRAVSISAQRPRLGRMVGARPWPGRFFAPIRLAVSMRSGQMLAIDSRPSPAVRAYLRQRAFLAALGGLVLLTALALAVRQTTRPLVRLSEGARRFAADLNAPDLPVTGSREMRDLSRAFNEMKGRIAGLVAERTRMLAGIAHDMRTYLTRLRLRAEFIDDPAQRAAAGRDLDEMAALLDDTLLFARRDAAGPQSATAIDLAAELRAVVALRREMGDAVTLAAAAPGLMIGTAPIAFRRIMANLIDNGLRHGGTVSIRAAAVGEKVLVNVADNGPGVSPDALGQLGEPFGRLDPSRDRESGGAGLGLAIVRALAERDGASVRFANRPEGGLSVTLAYPLWPVSR